MQASRIGLIAVGLVTSAAEIGSRLTDYAPALDGATADAGVRVQEHLLRALFACNNSRRQIRPVKLLVEEQGPMVVTR